MQVKDKENKWCGSTSVMSFGPFSGQQLCFCHNSRWGCCAVPKYRCSKFAKDAPRLSRQEVWKLLALRFHNVLKRRCDQDGDVDGWHISSWKLRWQCCQGGWGSVALTEKKWRRIRNDGETDFSRNVNVRCVGCSSQLEREFAYLRWLTQEGVKVREPLWLPVEIVTSVRAANPPGAANLTARLHFLPTGITLCHPENAAQELTVSGVSCVKPLHRLNDNLKRMLTHELKAMGQEVQHHYE